MIKIINGVEYELNESDMRDRERRNRIVDEISRKEQAKLDRAKRSRRAAKKKLKNLGVDDETLKVLLGDDE